MIEPIKQSSYYEENRTRHEWLIEIEPIITFSDIEYTIKADEIDSFRFTSIAVAYMTESK